MLISLTVVIISQYICVSNHQIAHLKYIQFLIFNIPQFKKGRPGTWHGSGKGGDRKQITR